MNKKIIKIILLILSGALLFGMFIKVAAEGLNAHERNECLQWEEQSKGYALFYLSDWQKKQCDHYGIKILTIKEQEIRFADSINYKEIVDATVFAYSSTESQTDDRPYEMANGKDTHTGAIACPQRFPFGTRVEIENRAYICEDRMNKRYRDGNFFDIWMLDDRDAVNWGVKKLKIKIY